jgi:uncharacterized membrane protein YoaK (UPF0700 family)
LAAGRPNGLVLIGLSAVAGSTDALSYLGLNQVFPANMTGNTVLLGVGLSTGDYQRAGRSAVALGAFVVGAALAGLLTADYTWRRLLTVGTVCELALLAAACGWWLSAGADLTSGSQHGLIALVATAMGVQSATVSRLDVGVSTTFITGTWTEVSLWASALVRGDKSAAHPDARGRHARQASVLLTYLCAAVLGGYVSDVAGPPAIGIPLGLLAVVAAVRSGARLREAARWPGPARTT